MPPKLPPLSSSFERAISLGREIRRVRIAQSAEHAAQRDFGDLIRLPARRIVRVDRIDRAFDQRQIVH